ncbi:hypothetical protein [Rummeliibacillus pycnus]|uniref:hypothetical protein n=1 Tax=Rummeliibacillus pycnus TaxID=101070 RepID=UPI0037C4F0F6
MRKRKNETVWGVIRNMGILKLENIEIMLEDAKETLKQLQASKEIDPKLAELIQLTQEQIEELEEMKKELSE